MAASIIIHTLRPKRSMYAIYAYIGVVSGVNGAAYIPVPWSVWHGLCLPGSLLQIHRTGFTKLCPSSVRRTTGHAAQSARRVGERGDLPGDLLCPLVYKNIGGLICEGTSTGNSENHHDLGLKLHIYQDPTDFTGHQPLSRLVFKPTEEVALQVSEVPSHDP